MTRIGDWAPAKPKIDMQFGWYGVDMRINPDLSLLAVSDWIERASTMASSDPRAYTMASEVFQTLLHPDDFDMFWAMAKQNRLAEDDLFPLAWDIIAKVTDLPTDAPSDSSDGRGTTGEPSTAGLLPVVLASEAGRPDRQLIYLSAAAQQAGMEIDEYLAAELAKATSSTT